MNLSALLSQAANQAASILAPMTDPDAEGDVTISGVNYTDVTMSIFEKVLVPTAQGYDEQRQIKLAIPRSQVTAAPDPSLRPAFTARGLTWRLTAIEPGAQFYVLTGVAA